MEVLTTDGWLTQKSLTVYGHIRWDSQEQTLLFRCTEPERDSDGTTVTMLSVNLRKKYELRAPAGHTYITDPQILRSLVEQNLVEVTGTVSYGTPAETATEVLVHTRSIKVTRS